MVYDYHRNKRNVSVSEYITLCDEFDYMDTIELVYERMKNKIVLDKRAEANFPSSPGDFVICAGCGKRMLIDEKTFSCPICGSDRLFWMDESHHSVTKDFLIKHGFFYTAK